MMRWTVVLTALLAAYPACAQQVAIDSAVYRERVANGEARIEPASRLARGDRVITILTWDAPGTGSYTVTSPVPAGLTLQSASYPGLEVSTDGGQTWRRPADPDRIPRGTTHLRLRVDGDGRMSYRAVVR
jgi:hypothetical protein